jgi:hypothetical protein
MFFPWAESVSAKCGRENNEKKIRIYDLENNGGGLNTLELIHPINFTFILYGHGEFIFPDTLSSHHLHLPTNSVITVESDVFLVRIIASNTHPRITHEKVRPFFSRIR